MDKLPRYEIVCKSLNTEEIQRQVDAIKVFPCVIHIYDRSTVLSTKGEAIMLCSGLDIGWYTREVRFEEDGK